MTGTEMGQARRKLGLTQQQLGDELHLSRVMIGLMERGDKPVERRTELSMRYLLICAGHSKPADFAMVVGVSPSTRK